MPKMKSNRSVRKRYKLSKKGKVLRKQAFKSHLMSSKNGKRRRHLRRTVRASKADEKRIKRLMQE